MEPSIAAMPWYRCLTATKLENIATTKSPTPAAAAGIATIPAADKTRYMVGTRGIQETPLTIRRRNEEVLAEPINMPSD